MTTMPAKETTKLTYDASYNAGYNAGFYANNKVSPTTRIDYNMVVDELNDDILWNRRAISAGYIFCIIILFIVAIAVALGFIALTISSLIAVGINTYMLIAPFVLAIIIGGFITRKRGTP